MDAFVFCTVQELTFQALLTVGVCSGLMTHMIGTNQLIVVCRIKNLAGMPSFFLPLADLKDDAGGELIIEVVEMAYIGLEIIQDHPDFFSGFKGINRFDGVKEFGKFGAGMKIHVGGIGIDTVADNASFMLHAEVLDFMAQRLEISSQLKNVCFRSAIGMQKLIDHQNSHAKHPTS